MKGSIGCPTKIGTQGSPGVKDSAATATPQGGGTSGSTQGHADLAAGTAGRGANGKNGAVGSTEGKGGGGGGWWGGGAYNKNAYNASGAGGSSYTGGAGGITPSGDVVNETYQQNFWDHGWARITWKGN